MLVEKMRRFAFGLFGSVLAVLPSYQVLLSRDKIFAGRDLSSLFLPAKEIWSFVLRNEHAIPRWNFAVQAGTPFYADATLAPLHPLNLIFLWVPDSLQALNYFVLGQILCVFWAAYFFFSALFSAVELALAFSLMATWQGAVWSGIILPHLQTSLAGLWFLLACLWRFRASKNLLWLWLSGLALAIPLYGGDPQFSYMGIFVVAAGLFFGMRQSWSERARAFVICGVAAFLWSAPQLLPLLDLASHSVRGLGNLGVELAQHASFHPRRLWDLFLPLPFGNRVPTDTFGHPDFLNAAEPFVFSFYLGLGFWILLAGLLALRLRQDPPSLRLLWPFFAAATLVLLASFGSNFPLYGFLYHVLPGWSFFRYPERLVALFGVIVLVFAALLTKEQRPSRVLYLCLVLVLADLGHTSSQLVWAQPRWVADTESHPWRPAIADWKTKNPLRRFASASSLTERLVPRSDLGLDPVGRSTVSNWRWLHPNAASRLGLEDIHGVVNFESLYWQRLRTAFANDERSLRWLTGAALGITAHDTKIDLESLEALPYIYSAKKIYGGRQSLEEWWKSATWKDGEVFVHESQNSPLASGVLQVLRRQSRGIFSLRRQGEGPGVIVWNEQFSRHWHAYWNDKPMPTWLANGWAMAAPVEGEGLLEWRYENPWIIWGQCLGLTAFLCLVWLAWRKTYV